MEPKHLKFLECLCVKKTDVNVSSSASISAKIKCEPANLKAKLTGRGNVIKATITRVRTQSLTLNNEGSLSAKLSVKDISIRASLNNEGDISKDNLTAKYSARQEVANTAKLDPTVLEKIVGDFGDFECIQKLYPIADVDTDLAFGKFVGPNKQSSNLYTFIDEGVFTGDHDKPFGQSQIIADDNTTFIQPDAISTEGEYQYKSEVSNVIVRPDETRFRMRASAPLFNYEADVPPKYTIYDIKLTDPSGNLVVHYEDIIFKGDSDQVDKPTQNFSTFSSAPRINNVSENYGWQDDYPLMNIGGSGFTISFNVKVTALDDAFDFGFDFGSDYLALASSPLSTQGMTSINPIKNIHISAIEICNSGIFGEGYGPRLEDYLRLYTEVPAKGNRIERKIVPNFMPLADFDTGVWPSVCYLRYYRYNRTTP